MKTFIISLLVLLSLITGIFAYSVYLDTATSELGIILSSLSEEISNGKWKNCTEKINDLTKCWKKNESILSMFNDHEDVDHIRLSISELNIYIKNQNKEEALKALEETVIYMERIRKNENLSLENVLTLTPVGLSCHIML